jgi:hypothetical protein
MRREHSQSEYERREGTQHRPSSFDSRDLAAGIFLALGIPFLCYVVLIATGATDVPENARIDVKGPVPLDAEELRTRLESFRRLLDQNAAGFLARAQDAKGPKRLRELNYARRCLATVVQGLKGLESEVARDPASASTLGDGLQILAQLKADAQGKLTRAQAIENEAKTGG